MPLFICPTGNSKISRRRESSRLVSTSEKVDCADYTDIGSSLGMNKQ
jgi:hypothetical protein